MRIFLCFFEPSRADFISALAKVKYSVRSILLVVEMDVSFERQVIWIGGVEFAKENKCRVTSRTYTVVPVITLLQSNVVETRV